MSKTTTNNNENNDGIRLVCAGLGRTGTLSLWIALGILGYKPNHYIDYFNSKEWSDLVKGTITKEEVELAVLEAFIKNPTCDIYTDILERYPNAKVILTVKDDPKAFEKSWKIFMDTMIITEHSFSWFFPSFFQWIPHFERLKHFRKLLGTTHLRLPPGALAHGWRDQPDGWLGDQYTKHNEHVIANVPPERLLVFNVKEGWEPLCRFLGCEAPFYQKEFPHDKDNTKESLIQLKKTLELAVYGWIPVVVALVATAAVGGQRFLQRR